MAVIWTKRGLYRSHGFPSEREFEEAVLAVKDELFGPNRVYVDVKRKIGKPGGIRNIPDGYLIDLNGKTPDLFVVENELARHEHLRHIAVQILQFSLAFEAEPFAVKKILLEALHDDPTAKGKCEAYVAANGLRNLDHLLEILVYERPFSALVIIDAVPENLETILAQKFKFGVEVLELSRYRNTDGEYFYHFEAFLADVTADVVSVQGGQTRPPTSLSELDTVVVPARKTGFEQVFLGENRWYKIRIHGSMRPRIKYIAAYQVAPVSAITHVAPVGSIEPWQDSGKFVLNFAEPAEPIKPIPMLKGKGSVRTFQGKRYTSRERLEKAKSLDDLW